MELAGFPGLINVAGSPPDRETSAGRARSAPARLAYSGERASMAITAEQVKALRQKTGAGMMECKAALTETGGNLDEAVTVLRKRGLAQAARRAGRSTSQGLVSSYIHMGGKIGVLVEVNCESDFVARTEGFQQLVKEIAMHVAAADPKYVRREEVPDEVIEKEKAIYRAQFEGSGKPPQVVEKIVEGKIVSYYTQIVLVDQPSVRDQNVTVGEMVAQAIAKTGENISIARFARFKLGESAEQA
jgi:elongation factor Ts